MASPLPALRRGLDLMPSPIEDQPGLLVRDPFRYSDSVLVLPPALAPLLAFFDGTRTQAELHAALVRMTGVAQAGGLADHVVETLSRGGFLEDAAFLRLRDARHAAFAAARRREAAHAGGAYPDEEGPLREALARSLDGIAPSASGMDGLVGIAAPHVSPEGAWSCYGSAYSALRPDLAGRTFIVLGTSHYGEPESFGLTRKPYATPLGETTPDLGFVDRLAAAGPAVRMEDYCHAVEHSIEFQVVFLQHLLGPALRVVPILCGPFARSTSEGGRPEDDEGVRRFLGALAELVASEAERLFWVLGIDMSHMGRRYGDSFRARAGFGKLAAVAARDRRRIERLTEGDARGFWELLQEGADPLRWCGASPLYTFLAAVGPCRGELLRYEQWNIDDASVVSFASLAFRRPSALSL
jgi:hypothetical protein